MHILTDTLIIEGSDLQEFITSHKSCKLTDFGIGFEAVSSKCQLNFSKYSIVKNIELFFKRNSGLGQIIINGSDYTIHSKIVQPIMLPGIENLEFTRSPNASGEITLIKLALYLTRSEDHIMVQQWKKLIKQCNSNNIQGFRLVGEKLYVASGAVLQNAEIVTKLTTNPPNIFLNEGQKIIFKEAGEIVELEVKDGPPILNSDTSFPHLNPPTPTVLNNTVISESISNITKYKNNIIQIDKEPTTKSISYLSNNISMFIYDSQEFNEFNPRTKASTKTVEFISSNGHNYLLLRRGGTFIINFSSLRPNMPYMFIINGKKLNGNGKIQAGFISDNTKVHQNTVIENTGSEQYVKVATLPHSNQIFLSMPEGESVGEILIDRLRIIGAGYDATPDYTLKPNENERKVYANLKLHKKFVIVIPSYNNRLWCQKNVKSVINQNYDNYRVIYTDDCSSDDTFEIVQEIVNSSDKIDKFTLIKNEKRLGALHNLYNMITSCDDDEIILTVDGDDALAHEDVLNKLNYEYSTADVWMTYGQYKNSTDGGTGISQELPANVIANNSYRQYQWSTSHLRVFYAWLFKCIKREDLLYNGDFFAMAWDMVIFFPMLEMAGNHSKFIKDILYIYNMDNPINDHKVNRKLQQDSDRYARGLPRYKPLAKSVIHEKNIGLMIIATGKYHKYIQGLIESADKFFLKQFNVTYYVFSDKEHNIKSSRDIVQIHIDHRPFPHATRDRYKHFCNSKLKLSKEDYLYYVDADCLFVDNVGEEILGNLVSTLHCGFYKRPGPVEDNIKSSIWIEPNRYKWYLGGGFQGGRSDNYLKMSEWCVEKMDIDLANGMLGRWHDESYWNRYCVDNEPDVILSPSYHYPQGEEQHYKKIWSPETFKPVILLLDKNHVEMRN